MTATPREHLDATISGIDELIESSDVELQIHVEQLREINTMIWKIIDEIADAHEAEMSVENLDVAEEETQAHDNITKSEEST